MREADPASHGDGEPPIFLLDGIRTAQREAGEGRVVGLALSSLLETFATAAAVEDALDSCSEGSDGDDGDLASHDQRGLRWCRRHAQPVRVALLDGRCARQGGTGGCRQAGAHARARTGSRARRRAHPSIDSGK